jgi:TPR repeat protein
LYYHGIGVKANKSLAFEKFKRSAKLNDPDANIVCYFLEQAVEKKYDFLENGIMIGSPRIMSTLGYMLKRGKLDNILIKNKIISLLYKVGAQKGISVSMKNYAAILISGSGIKKNLDLGYEYYYKSIQSGCYEAKMWLDNLFPGAESFR